MLTLKNISKSFDNGDTYAVRDVSLTVMEGETMVLLGSSGCGKTTTLKMINRLVEPTEGEISIDGVNVLERDPVELRREIGYVFQGIGLFPHMTVAENVAILDRLRGMGKKKRMDAAHDLLRLVELDPDQFGPRYPAELSGGQQQRVGVARALAANPKYLLMDEPFGALDAVTRANLQQELLNLKQKLQKTIVFVTHDLFEALTLGDEIAVMHEGRLEQVGLPQQILNEPATEFVKDLFVKPAMQLEAYRRHINHD